MRWPIQVQLLLPMLCVVLLAIVLASGATAYWGSIWAHRQEEENVRRVVATLTEATFPLTEKVLRQASGLSGAEYAFLDQKSRVQRCTLRLAVSDEARLARLPVGGNVGAGQSVVIGAREYLARRMPVAEQTPSLQPGSLVVLYPKDLWTARVRQAAYPALVAGSIAGAVAVLMTVALARRFVRPIGQLVVQTAAIARGEFAPVAVPPRDDEIRDLAQSINQITDWLARYESEVRRNERLWTLGQLGAGMAHQLRNSATGAMMDIELHQRECPMSTSDGKPLQVALRQLRLMESYLQSFLSVGRSSANPRQQIELGRVLKDALELVRPAFVHNRVELCFHGAEKGLAVWGEADSLRELVVNLLLNALEAAKRHAGVAPKVVVELQRCDSQRAAVHVKDSGRGPPPETAARLFEPFVSEKPEGAGLGLFVARQIAEAHQGSIGWQRQDEMTCFTVELPLIPADTDHGSPAGY